MNPECNRPTDKLYCCYRCGDRARYILKYGVGRKRHKGDKRRQQKHWQPHHWKNEREGIEYVVAKAIQNGTCYNVAQLAPQ